jgi:hypothetical protein
MRAAAAAVAAEQPSSAAGWRRSARCEDPAARTTASAPAALPFSRSVAAVVAAAPTGAAAARAFLAPPGSWCQARRRPPQPRPRRCSSSADPAGRRPGPARRTCRTLRAQQGPTCLSAPEGARSASASCRRPVASPPGRHNRLRRRSSRRSPFSDRRLLRSFPTEVCWLSRFRLRLRLRLGQRRLFFRRRHHRRTRPCRVPRSRAPQKQQQHQRQRQQPYRHPR